ncbi:unnamed protein product [Ambrosiozyma monospora]|uniref:Unnamed protein product n=1 Tax=Ambrosiozyma monospora TaxID=43982 RepID=A0ACB5UC96_AMBMO|nr:unnamed protein product [Ambrosiozyma monospora]
MLCALIVAAESMMERVENDLFWFTNDDEVALRLADVSFSKDEDCFGITKSLMKDKDEKDEAELDFDFEQSNLLKDDGFKPAFRIDEFRMKKNWVLHNDIVMMMLY